MASISKRVSGSWVSGDERVMKTATDTITTLPADLYADGNNATVGLVGNMFQSGTPSPIHPIQPSECGERTENLCDGQLQQGYYAYATGDYTLGDNYVCTHLIPCTENTTYTFRCINAGGGSKNYGYVFFDSAQNRIGSDYINELTEGDVVTYTATTPQNTAFLAINVSYGRRVIYVHPSDITDFMLNSGSTPKPYEPYGYKIPISSANTTTPVYLGEVETTRKIKKLVLDGTENWNEGTSNYYIFINVSGRGEGIPNSTALSTHTESGVVVNNNGITLFFRKSVFVHSSLADFKTYLQQQYANGTPVTVWYVLATEETGIVNEPIRKIGDYADTVSGITIPTITGVDSFDILTTLKPSEVSLAYTGWHDATVKEWDGSQWS